MTYTCKCCGECCSNFLPLSVKEKKQLQEIVRKRKIKVNRILEYSVCPFLTNENKCSIYEDRPLICKSFHCQKFMFNDYSNCIELISEIRTITDIRNEVFNERSH